MPTQAPQTADHRPAIAIVSNSHTPYRLHLHQRIAREITGIRLWSVYTHELSNAPWNFAATEDIGPVVFGKGESSDQQTNPKNALREWKRAGRIIRWIVQNNVRFVLMMGYNDPGRLRIMRWCHHHNISCWLFGDSNILGDRPTGIKAILKRSIVTHIIGWCDGVFSCGSLGRDYFLRYGAKPDRCLFFPYEPDYDLVQKLDPAIIEQTRQRFALLSDRRRITFSGRLAPVKRPDLLIDAFSAIAAKRPNWDLLMVGNGPLRDELKARVPADLSARVSWTGFLDDQATVAALYRLSDVLVLPSDNEPWALVINEAAAAGIAIVSSHVVGASAELVRDGINGRLFQTGDLRSLTDALLDSTDLQKIDAYKTASAAILTDWRKRGDPVQGLRQALTLCNILPPP
jgi:glycosyltransferase involved in cell wall biosynthesis